MNVSTLTVALNLVKDHIAVATDDANRTKRLAADSWRDAIPNSRLGHIHFREHNHWRSAHRASKRQLAKLQETSKQLKAAIKEAQRNR